MMLKLGPEDVPYSRNLLRQMIIFNALSGIFVLSFRIETHLAVINMALDLALLLGFTYLLLRALHYLPRFVQTATALCGVGVLFHLLTWPLLVQLGIEDAGDNAKAMVSLLMLFLISWQLLVMAHIYRRAIESSMSSAIALSFALFILSIVVSQFLFPDVS